MTSKWKAFLHCESLSINIKHNPGRASQVMRMEDARLLALARSAIGRQLDLFRPDHH
ncbi:hypothetical protein ABIB00_007991, partial [Bradyrhizobium sp. LB14.3]